MLFLIAWRNIWRNRIRSLIVMLAVALGLGAGIFLMSFSWGLSQQRVQNIIETELSHIQLHHPEFKEDQLAQFGLANAMETVEAIKAKPEVEMATARIILNGMINSAKVGAGVKIHGIDPSEERQITHLDQKRVSGKYFEGMKRNPIFMGEKLAEKLKIKLRKKVILTFQDGEGEIRYGAFRVVGLYTSINSKYDESNVFVRRSDLQQLLGTDSLIHEIAVLLPSDEQTLAVKADLQASYPEAQVEDWRDLAPDLKLVIESFDISMRIFIGIILLALAFGIVNTMLMAILERTRELGMLKAVGMNKRRIFAMIVLETIMLSGIGAPLGMLLTHQLIRYFGTVGIDLSMFAEGLSSYGYDSMVYIALEPQYYLQIGVMVVITAVVSALYPAMKALSLRPAEAVRAL